MAVVIGIRIYDPDEAKRQGRPADAHWSLVTMTEPHLDLALSELQRVLAEEVSYQASEAEAKHSVGVAGAWLRRSMPGCQSLFPRAPGSRSTVSQVRVMTHQQAVVGRRKIAAPLQAGHQREQFSEYLRVDLAHAPRQPVHLVPGGGGHAPEHELAHTAGMFDGIRQRQR